MKAVTVDAHGSVVSAIASPWLAAVLVLSAAAFACFQRGLQLGPPVPVIALMTAGTSAAAVAIGLLAFGEPLGASPAIAALHLIAFLCAGAAAVALMIAQERPVLEPGARSAAPNTSSRALARLS
jgi:drug/metabolite transporter (DMT)-like permease